MVDIKCVQICQMQEWIRGDCMNLIVSEIENLQMIQIIQESWVQSGYVIRWQVECNQGVKPTVWKKNTIRLCPNMFSWETNYEFSQNLQAIFFLIIC